MAYLRIQNLQWVDMESIYFNRLLSKINNPSLKHKQEIKSFLDQFDYLKKILIVYLKKQDTGKITKERCNICFDSMLNCFKEEKSFPID